MTDRKTVMSLLEGLTLDDWYEWHSDSEVQETAKAALELLKEQEPVEPKRGFVLTRKGWFCGSCGYHLNRTCGYCAKCGRPVKFE